MAVNIHITIIELNALHTKRQNLFQELDAVIHLLMPVTEKLMDELAQCYNVLPQLDINNTIDHRPEGDEKWFLENEKTVTQFCRKLAAERPLKDIRDEYNYPKKKGI